MRHDILARGNGYAFPYGKRHRDRWRSTSNAMTYLIEGLNCFSGPPAGTEAAAQKALVHIFLYMPHDCCMRLVPTVYSEFLKIKDRAKLNDHLSWAMTHFSEVRPLPDVNSVEKKAAELAPFHNGRNDKNDCKILAECELSQIKTLLTSDPKF